MNEKRNDPQNHYDKSGIVKQEGLIRAAGLKVAAYRVRDPETGEYGKLNFHMTYGDTIIGIMGEECALLFCNFVRSSLGLSEEKSQ